MYNDDKKNEAREKAIKALEAMGVTYEEAVQEDAEARVNLARQKRDARICLCGHAMGRHTEIAGVVFCKPSRMECPCKKVRPVLEVGDTRLFIRKTDGAASRHALGRGITASVEAGRSVEWLVDLVCDRCGKSDDAVQPVPVTQTGHYSHYGATGYDALLCKLCQQSI